MILLPGFLSGLLALYERTGWPSQISVAYVLPFVPLALWLIVGLTIKAVSLRHDRDRPAALDRLSDLMDEGNNKILNHTIYDDTGHIQWRVDWMAWPQRVEDHLETEFSRAERNGFRNLVLVEYVALPDCYDNFHLVAKNQLAMQLQKIRGIIAGYRRRDQA